MSFIFKTSAFGKAKFISKKQKLTLTSAFLKYLHRVSDVSGNWHVPVYYRNSIVLLVPHIGCNLTSVSIVNNKRRERAVELKLIIVRLREEEKSYVKLPNLEKV